LTISGCSVFQGKPEVEIRVVEVQVPVTHPPLPRDIDLKEPKFYVVSRKNLKEFLANIEKEGNGVFVAMSITDYELMAYNIQDIKRYLEQMKEVVVYYRSIDKKENTKGE